MKGDRRADAEPSEHWLQTPSGIRIAFDVYAQPGRETAWIIAPGFFKCKRTPTFRRLSQALARDRDVICMDFRGHGRSGGCFTFSAREGEEFACVLEWARERYRSISVIGFSLGAAVATNVLAEDRRSVDGLVIVGAPAAFEDIEFKFWSLRAIRDGLADLGRGAGCWPGSPFLKKRRPVESIGRLEGVPVVIIHGTADAIVGVGHAHRLFAAARSPKRLAIIEGGSHAEALFRSDPEDFLRHAASVA